MYHHSGMNTQILIYIFQVIMQIYVRVNLDPDFKLQFCIKCPHVTNSETFM